MTASATEELLDRYGTWSRVLRAAQRELPADDALVLFYARKVTDCETAADALGVPIRYLAQHAPIVGAAHD